jgi:DNA helicase-2/ATP-dependent DNA helicase PcrA
MSEIFDIKVFASERDNILIAPAGFGKTHTISECLKHTDGRQLILTHTQAGVASIKDKLQKCSISKDSYNVETISSFAKRYVVSFSNAPNLPDETDGNFYSYFIENATKILSLQLVRDIIKISYTGLFVDEYQDCTIEQHKLVLALAEVLPTHILGDPLQGIFGFKGQRLVDLDNALEMGRFNIRYKLDTPHRWIKSGNPQLGQELLQIRDDLENGREIDLLRYSKIEFKQGAYSDNYRFLMEILKNCNSVLVIDSDSKRMTTRENFVVAFKYIPLLIEAFDGRDFYESAIHFDNKDGLPSIDILHKFISSKFSNLDNWYDKANKRFKNKRDPAEERELSEIKGLVGKLALNYSFLDMKAVISKIGNLRGVNCARKDLLNSLGKSMEYAHNSKITVLDAMRNYRNGIRRVGRKMYGKCVGTTLLTKGLEFSTVIVLDADKFKDPQNFYVAFSRCTKRLIVLGHNSKMRPYPAAVFQSAAAGRPCTL